MPRLLRRVLLLAGALVLAGLAIPAGHYLLRAFARWGYEGQLDAQRAQVRVEPHGADSVLVRNPIYETGQDPWITADTLPDGTVDFLYVYSDHDRLSFKRGPDPLLFDEVAPYTSWAPGPDDAHGQLDNLWAPELHRVGGEWVVYFAANDGAPLVAGTHKTYALRAIDNDPRRGFTFAGEVRLPDDAWAIDATHLRVAGRDYLVWSGWRTGERLNQYLFACALADAFTPVGERVEISAPTYDWELRGRRAGLWPSINEGPVALYRDGDTFLAFSASGSWSDDYAVGVLRLTGEDPLAPGAWTKSPTPLLQRTADVLGPGHNSFAYRRGQLLAFYHAAKYSRAAWDREVHVAPVTWGADGWPRVDGPSEEVTLAR